MAALAWLLAMFVPLWTKTLVTLPTWLAIMWMIVWALLGYVLAPYGLWKHTRTRVQQSGRSDPE
jgi:hypothetical protein